MPQKSPSITVGLRTATAHYVASVKSLLELD